MDEKLGELGPKILTRRGLFGLAGAAFLGIPTSRTYYITSEEQVARLVRNRPSLLMGTMYLTRAGYVTKPDPPAFIPSAMEGLAAQIRQMEDASGSRQ